MKLIKASNPCPCHGHKIASITARSLRKWKCRFCVWHSFCAIPITDIFPTYLIIEFGPHSHWRWPLGSIGGGCGTGSSSVRRCGWRLRQIVRRMAACGIFHLRSNHEIDFLKYQPGVAITYLLLTWGRCWKKAPAAMRLLWRSRARRAVCYSGWARCHPKTLLDFAPRARSVDWRLEEIRKLSY